MILGAGHALSVFASERSSGVSRSDVLIAAKQSLKRAIQRHRCPAL